VGLGLRRVDPDQLRARMIGEADGAVQHPGKFHVVDVGLVAQGQLSPLIPGGPGSDPAAQVGLRDGLASPGSCRELDRVHDLHVAGAPAEVPRQGPGDLVPAGVGVLGEQRLGLHHDPRGAEPAL
jgi:hypothetical protein